MAVLPTRVLTSTCMAQYETHFDACSRQVAGSSSLVYNHATPSTPSVHSKPMSPINNDGSVTQKRVSNDWQKVDGPSTSDTKLLCPSLADRNIIVQTYSSLSGRFGPLAFDHHPQPDISRPLEHS